MRCCCSCSVEWSCQLLLAGEQVLCVLHLHMHMLCQTTGGQQGTSATRIQCPTQRMKKACSDHEVPDMRRGGVTGYSCKGTRVTKAGQVRQRATNKADNQLHGRASGARHKCECVCPAGGGRGLLVRRMVLMSQTQGYDASLHYPRYAHTGTVHPLATTHHMRRVRLRGQTQQNRCFVFTTLGLSP